MSEPIDVIKDLPAPRVEDAHLHALLRKTRALKALGASCAAVIHATSEDAMQRDMCRAIVEAAGYRMAWIGWAQTDAERRVRPVAWAGATADYPELADIRWDDSERGRGPTGRCIRTGETQVASDLKTDAAMEPWRQRALEIGYRSSAAVPLKVDGAVGALNIYASEPDAFDGEELSLLQQIAAELCFGLAMLRVRARLERGIDRTIQVVAGSAERRDPNMPGHQRRVAAIAAAIATELRLDEDRIRGIRIAASIHDIGKSLVPLEILSAPRQLSVPEFELVKQHAEAGYQMLKDIDLPWPVATVVRQHHERLDGTGYPLGLKGEDLLLESRIVAVADVLEAVASRRPHRPPYGIDDALEILRKGRGTEFDEGVVDAARRLVREKGFVIPD